MSGTVVSLATMKEGNKYINIGWRYGKTGFELLKEPQWKRGEEEEPMNN